MPKFAWKYKRTYFRPKQQKAYTMLGLTLLSLIIFGNFAMRPALVTIIELQKKIKDQKAAVEKLDKKLKNLSRAQTELRKIQADLPLIEHALPRGENSSQLLEDLYLQTEKEELRIEYLSFRESADTNIQVPNKKIKIKEMTFMAEVNGNFVSFLDFLENNQNAMRQINVQTLSVRSGRSGSGESYNFNADTYFYNNE